MIALLFHRNGTVISALNTISKTIIGYEILRKRKSTACNVVSYYSAAIILEN